MSFIALTLDSRLWMEPIFYVIQDANVIESRKKLGLNSLNFSFNNARDTVSYLSSRLLETSRGDHLRVGT